MNIEFIYKIFTTIFTTNKHTLNEACEETQVEIITESVVGEVVEGVAVGVVGELVAGCWQPLQALQRYVRKVSRKICVFSQYHRATCHEAVYE